MTSTPRGYDFGEAFAYGGATDALTSVANNPAIHGLWVPYWEGAGNAPDEVADRAQNPGIADGNPFAVLTDWGINANHATQADPTFQPTYSSADRALVAAGAGARMDSPPLALDYFQWVYAVVEYTGALDTQGNFVEHGNNAATGPGFVCAMRYGAGGSFLIGYPNQGAGPPGLVGVQGPALPGAYDAVEWQGDPEPTTRAVLTNGAPIMPLFNGRSLPNQTNVLPLRLLSRFDAATPAFPVLCRLRFLAVGAGDLSAGGRAQVRAVAATVL